MSKFSEQNLISIVIPVKNEAKNIAKLITQIENICENRYNYEILVMNHSSKDNTQFIVREMIHNNPRIRLYEISDQKYKLGELIQIGINLTHGIDIITMDGDLSHPAKFLPEFFNVLSQGAEVVIGGRYKKNQPYFLPKERYFISKLFNVLPRLFLHNQISDYTTGYRGFKKSLYKKLSIVSKDFNFHLEINMKLVRYAEDSAEIPIQYIKRKEGSSKLRYKEQFLGYVYAIFLGWLN